MKFEQAMEKLKSGKKIRRRQWEKIISIRALKGRGFETETDRGQVIFQPDIPISYEDFIGDDWEILPDPQNYKVFISKQKELYINGRKISNDCTYSLTDWIDYTKPRKETLMERKATIDVSFVVDIDECLFEW